MSRNPEDLRNTTQSMCLKELPGNPRSSRQNRRRRPDPVNKLAKGAFLSLLLFSKRAAAFNFAPSTSTPVNTTAANAAIPRPPFNITTGNVTISPWNITTSNVTITSSNSTTNATTSIPTNSANPTANAPALPPNSRTPIQLTVANSCGESIWPGIVTQNGLGPATGGFELTPGTSRMMFVSPDWAGRIWGRTNCSFNSDGSGASTYSGVNGYGAACLTGDCFGKLNCQFAGQVPTTLAEFTLQGGSTNSQTFYDISLVDGYNLPLAIIYHPAPNTTWIPPNLTNCACIASPGYLTPSSSTSPFPSPNPSDLNTNFTYPMPYEPTQTNNTLLTWCPSPLLLQKYPPSAARGAGSSLFPHPSSDTTAPPRRGGPGVFQSQSQSQFQPCLSPCSATHAPADCCTGRYNSPETCRPSAYSRAAKRVCPDAYSFAYDDRASTFVVPAMAGGGGWEVRFCPRGRSTDILGAFGDEVRALGAGGGLSREGWGRVRDRGYVEGRWRSGAGVVGRGRGWGLVMGVVVVVAGWVMA